MATAEEVVDVVLLLLQEPHGGGCILSYLLDAAEVHLHEKEAVVDGVAALLDVVQAVVCLFQPGGFDIFYQASGGCGGFWVFGSFYGVFWVFGSFYGLFGF